MGALFVRYWILAVLDIGGALKAIAHSKHEESTEIYFKEATTIWNNRCYVHLEHLGIKILFLVAILKLGLA